MVGSSKSVCGLNRFSVLDLRTDKDGNVQTFRTALKFGFFEINESKKFNGESSQRSGTVGGQI